MSQTRVIAFLLLRNCLLLQIQSLRIAIGDKTSNSPLGTNTTFLVAAKGHSWVELEVSVDPDIAGFDTFGELVGALDAARPDGRPQTVKSIVGLDHCFVIGAIAEQWDDRAYLFSSISSCTFTLLVQVLEAGRRRK